jgi:hypothetical protein
MNEEPVLDDHEKNDTVVSKKELLPSKAMVIDTSVDSMIIDGPGIMTDQKCVAELTLGGADTPEGEHYDPQALYLFKITDPEGHDYKELARRAQQAGVEPTKYMLLAKKYGGSSLAAGAFLPDVKEDADNSRSLPVLGREGNIHWFEYGVDQGRDAKWNPFKENKSISPRQLFLGVTNESEKSEITFLGLSKNSRTIIKANIIELPDETTEPQTTASKKVGRFGLARLLKRQS